MSKPQRGGNEQRFQRGKRGDNTMKDKVFFCDNGYIYYGEIVSKLYEIRYEDHNGNTRNKIVLENEIVPLEKAAEIFETQRTKLETFVTRIQNIISSNEELVIDKNDEENTDTEEESP